MMQFFTSSCFFVGTSNQLISRTVLLKIVSYSRQKIPAKLVLTEALRYPQKNPLNPNDPVEETSRRVLVPDISKSQRTGILLHHTFISSL
jgi:hypothetical protein